MPWYERRDDARINGVLHGRSFKEALIESIDSVFGELSGTAELAEDPCFKINGLPVRWQAGVIARLLFWGGTSLCRLPAAGGTESLIESEIP